MVICRIFRRSILISRFINCTSAETNTPLLNKFTKRTHTCGELRLPDVGKRVILYGWLAHKRKQKNNSFFVLRDAFGKVQALVPNELLTTIPDFNLESSICIEGTVVDRGRNRNKEMATGDVEIVTEQIEILNPVTEIMLPLFSSSNEMNRLTYRYLDLRWERMQGSLRLRAKIISQMRRFLEDKCGFVDVQTPTLASFTPGGAAEFPVPINKDGECFSLPQSPQIYKQLLMCGSMDRYYQIAICYRDETITPFRQLEFTQLDLELSFTDQESVMELVEQIVIESWPQGLEPKPIAPFPRISYSDAMNKYGMDKPDLRIPWEIFDAPFDLVEKNAKMFIARGAVPFLNEENLSQWKEWIEMLPEREDYSIIAGQNFATKFGRNSEFLQKHNIGDEDAIVVCAAQNQKHILEVLGRLRNFLAEAVGLRQSQNFHFVWVHKFPLFNRNEENGALESSHHPFTAPIHEHLDLLFQSKNLEAIEAQHYDLVLNGVEIGGGSIRIHDATLQRHILDEILKIDSSQLQHLLTALSYGAPPHGGFALGLDRYVTILNAKGDPNASIRNVIAFPKGKLGQCFMTRSPTLLPNNFLNRYGLFRKENEKKILL